MGLLAQIAYDSYKQRQQRQQYEQAANIFQGMNNSGGLVAPAPELEPPANSTPPYVPQQQTAPQPGLFGGGSIGARLAENSLLNNAPTPPPQLTPPPAFNQQVQQPQARQMPVQQPDMNQQTNQPLAAPQLTTLPAFNQQAQPLPPMTVIGQQPQTIQQHGAQMAGMNNYQGFNPQALNNQYFDQMQAQAQQLIATGNPILAQQGMDMLNNAYSNRSSRFNNMAGNQVSENYNRNRLLQDQYEFDTQEQRAADEFRTREARQQSEFDREFAESQRQYEIENTLARAQQGKLTQNEINQQEKNLRAEYRKDYEPNKKRIDHYNAVANIVKDTGGFNNLTGADDYQLMLEFAKSVNPTEAVMSDDRVAIAMAQGFGGAVESYLQRIKSKGTLGEDERAALVTTMRRNAALSQERISMENKRYTNLAVNSQSNPFNVVRQPPDLINIVDGEQPDERNLEPL